VSIFSKWRGGKDFDLASLDVPRLNAEGDIVVEALTPMVPFLVEFEGMPTVMVRLEGLTESEVARVVEAVRDDRCLLAAGYKLYSTYPILIYSLFVYDSPDGSSLALEGYRKVTSADVQDFVVSLGRNGGLGCVLLYSGDRRELVGSGKFSLHIPPFITPTSFPYRTNSEELRMLWLMFSLASKQRARIPESRLDFDAAVTTHMAREPNMSSSTEFDRSGVKSTSEP
jgi:hypothetical protein